MAWLALGGGSAASLATLFAALRWKGMEDGDDDSDAPHRKPR
jgi:hypothetical protein